MLELVMWTFDESMMTMMMMMMMMVG